MRPALLLGFRGRTEAADKPVADERMGPFQTGSKSWCELRVHLLTCRIIARWAGTRRGSLQSLCPCIPRSSSFADSQKSYRLILPVPHEESTSNKKLLLHKHKCSLRS